MRLRSIILTLLVCPFVWSVLPRTAWSQPIQGFYIDLGAGPRFAFPVRTTSYMPGAGGMFSISEKTGYDGQASVGYALGNGWRFELEGMFGRGAIKSVYTGPSTTSGSVENRGFMVNALFDMDVRSPFVYPYVGFGVGSQWTRLDGFVVTQTGKSGSFSASGGTNAVAGQAIAGLSFPIPNMPGLSMTADYRVMDILGGGSYSGASTLVGGTPAGGSIKFHNQFVQTAMFGVRYAFNTPPPPPDDSPAVVAPAPAAALQSYEVAFDPNNAALTDRARAVVRDAVRTSTRQGTTRIAVTANGEVSAEHRDDPRRLAERRANIVVAALIADGVPTNAISVAGVDQRTSGTASGRQGDRRIEVVIQ